MLRVTSEQELDRWLTTASPHPDIPVHIQTQDDWAAFVDARFTEGLTEAEAPRPEVCPICRSHMNADIICDFCGFGEDEELYKALTSAANMREAYAKY